MTTTPSFSIEQRDCIQEVSKVAMEQAADKLARLLDAFVALSIPHVEMFSPADISMALSSLQDSQSTSGVCQGFLGDGLSGEAMLIFSDANFTDLAKLLRYDDEIESYTEQELLMDAANVLIGASLKGLAEQLDADFSYSPPLLLGQHLDIRELISNDKNRSQALVIEVNYRIENYNINCDLLIMLTEDSLSRLLGKVDYLID